MRGSLVHGIAFARAAPEICKCAMSISIRGMSWLLYRYAKPFKTYQSSIPDAKEGGVVTRFPPESSYPHIGHAKAAHKRTVRKDVRHKKILRMDDTNPESRLEFYAAIKVGLEWLGIEYDIVKNTSYDIDMLLRKGAALANSGDIYVCTANAIKYKRTAQHKKNASAES